MLLLFGTHHALVRRARLPKHSLHRWVADACLHTSRPRWARTPQRRLSRLTLGIEPGLVASRLAPALPQRPGTPGSTDSPLHQPDKLVVSRSRRRAMHLPRLQQLLKLRGKPRQRHGISKRTRTVHKLARPRPTRIAPARTREMQHKRVVVCGQCRREGAHFQRGHSPEQRARAHSQVHHAAPKAPPAAMHTAWMS